MPVPGSSLKSVARQKVLHLLVAIHCTLYSPYLSFSYCPSPQVFQHSFLPSSVSENKYSIQGLDLPPATIANQSQTRGIPMWQKIFLMKVKLTLHQLYD